MTVRKSVFADELAEFRARIADEQHKQTHGHNGHNHSQSQSQAGAGPQANGHRNKQKQDDAAAKQPWRTVFRPVAEIIAEGDEDVKYHVEGLVPQGWLGMVVADTKVGKTLLMLQLARAMGLGTEFLGKKANAGSVILALVDDPKVLSKKRLRETLAEVPNVRAYIDRWTPQTLQALEEAVAEEKPDLVVVDTLVKVGPSIAGAENDAPIMNGVLERLTALTSNEKTTVILLHHENRGGGVRGSSAIEGAAPFVIKLKSDDPDGRKGRLVTLTMDWKLAPIDPLVLKHEDGGFTVQGTVGEVKQAERCAEIENAVLASVKARQGPTSNEVVAGVGKRRQDVLVALEHLSAEGRIEGRKQEPQGRKPATVRWYARPTF